MSGYKRALAEAKYFAKADYATLKIGNHGYAKGMKSGACRSGFAPGSGIIFRETDAYDRYIVQNMVTEEKLCDVHEYALAEALNQLGIYNEDWRWERNEDTDLEKYRNYRQALRAHDEFERIETLPQLKVEKVNV